MTFFGHDKCTFTSIRVSLAVCRGDTRLTVDADGGINGQFTSI